MLPFEDLIEKKMSTKRFEHSKGVARAAQWLATRYGADVEKASIAGMLHDVTKEWKSSEHMEFLHKYNIGITKYEYASKKLLHAVTGSCLAKTFFKITDLDILSSIRFHTTARANMSVLNKVIFLADFISDDRHFSGVGRLRTLASLSLDEAIFEGLLFTINELLKDNSIIHPDTFNAYNHYVIQRSYGKSSSFLDFSDFLCTKKYKCPRNKKVPAFV